MPYNFFNKFKKACKHDRKNIIPWGGVLTDAENHFNLRTETQLYEFIIHDGLEDLTHQNTTEWRNNPKPESPIMVYAYNFRTMCKLGYIAIMRNEMLKKWIIKSFKLSTANPLIFNSNAMQSELKKAITKKKERNNG